MAITVCWFNSWNVPKYTPWVNIIQFDHRLLRLQLHLQKDESPFPPHTGALSLCAQDCLQPRCYGAGDWGGLHGVSGGTIFLGSSPGIKASASQNQGESLQLNRSLTGWWALGHDLHHYSRLKMTSGSRMGSWRTSVPSPVESLAWLQCSEVWWGDLWQDLVSA